MAPTLLSTETRSELHRAILLTVLYNDVFDHPLTLGELHRYLMVPCPDRALLEQAVAELDGGLLGSTGGFVHWRGREATIEIRRRRQELAAQRWPPARRFGRWLGRVPFLRMVAVCGSQAVENGDLDGDVDLFLITEPGRLWLVQAMTMVLRRAGRLLGADFCPNYLLTTASLAVEERNLYGAREVAQIVPLWGAEAFERFLACNRWVEGYLPQSGSGRPRQSLEEAPRRWPAAVLERRLGGRFGDWLDHWIHRVLLRYYCWRLKRHGWGREEIERAYRRDRQSVIAGGYAAAVAHRFVDRGSRELGGELSRAELEGWFFGRELRGAEARETLDSPDPLYAGLMAARYGGGR